MYLLLVGKQTSALIVIAFYKCLYTLCANRLLGTRHVQS